jgi:hypothetical protein
MWDRLFGRKKAKELPEYSALASRPSRELPAELVQQERSEAFGKVRGSIQRDLLEEPRRPSNEASLLTAFVSDQENGVVTITLPGDAGRCLPVFTTPLRAADYQQTLFAGGPRTRYLCSAPVQFVGMLRDIQKMGITSFAIDRCPRCSAFAVIGSPSVKTADDVVVLWSLSKAGELARTQLYFEYALGAARAERLDVARDVALEAVGHVTMQDPRLHLLLGQVAVGLGDRTLLGEARTFLAFMKLDAWARRLDEMASSGSADFADPE